MDFRFFQFTTKNFDDYCRAENKNHAEEIFERFYPKVKGEVKEVFMKDFNRDNKSFTES